ncbi:MAG: sigma-70 family RNA polymerase sigma factor [Propionibacteriaceae bacterium]|jgi:RNA polymerase sigma factor (sigma-70 family)|nr:sigma-70 family RNA polymerase sigma factor [Propionibacteriaceae bacterium]
MERPRLSQADEVRLAKQIEAGLLAQSRLDGPDPTAYGGDGNLRDDDGLRRNAPDALLPASAAAPARAPADAASDNAATSVSAPLTAADGPPTDEELRALARQGVLAKETMALANLGLVRVIAAEAGRRSAVPRADLFQEGCLALGQAIIRYDYRRGRFGPYAAFWIRSALRHLAPSATTSLPDDLMDERPVRRIDATVTRQALGSGLAHLSSEERRVVCLRHGWGGEPASLSQVAARLDLSVGKVRRLESQGLARLREHWLAAAA